MVPVGLICELASDSEGRGRVDQSTRSPGTPRAPAGTICGRVIQFIGFIADGILLTSRGRGSVRRRWFRTAPSHPPFSAPAGAISAQ